MLGWRASWMHGQLDAARQPPPYKGGCLPRRHQPVTSPFCLQVADVAIVHTHGPKPEMSLCVIEYLRQNVANKLAFEPKHVIHRKTEIAQHCGIQVGPGAGGKAGRREGREARVRREHPVRCGGGNA